MQGFLYRILCGFLMGISVFAPGFSASILAVVLGIYERLLGIVVNPFKNFKSNFFYLLPMGIGAVVSLVLFVMAFEYLFTRYETATYFLFMGLIAGNLPPLYKDVRKKGFLKRDMAAFIIAFVFALGLGFLKTLFPDTQVSGGEVNLWLLAVCGVIAGAAAIVPGMSVSMVLMIFGVYHFLLHAAKSLDVIIILVVGISFLMGLIALARVIKYMFARFSRAAGYIVMGFMAGSLGGLCIGLPVQEGFSWLTGAGMFILGLGLSVLFFMFGEGYRRMEKSS